jgi:Reverse transcriptase (RNA-dependent DNA polymerase)
VRAVIEEIYTAWKEGNIASLLLLDISGAFDNVSHVRLAHNLSKRRIPTPIVRWVGNFLTDRYTELVLSEYTKPRFLIRDPLCHPCSTSTTSQICSKMNE